MPVILHLSSVHFQPDSRIWYREIRSLSDSYQVVLAAPGNILPGTGIEFIPLHKPRFRFWRMISASFRGRTVLRKVKPALLHLHDPELIPLGWIASRRGIPVIFDMHELLAADLGSKSYLGIFAKPLGWLFQKLQPVFLRNFHLVAAEENYLPALRNLGRSRTLVRNWLPEDFISQTPAKAGNRFRLIYVGVLHPNRDISTILDAFQLLPEVYSLDFIGPDHVGFMKTLLGKIPAETRKRIHWHGFLPFEEVIKILEKSGIGLSIITEMQNQGISYPTKFFEYMGQGMPFITSDFPLYRNLLEKAACCLFVQPGNSRNLAAAIENLGEPAIFEQMASNSLKLIKENYHWNTEYSRLKDLYDKLLA